ncbi:hypothetical protein [Nonomuraea sp. NEAU-A123]|uniref:hypothetical protein n=1 Tax=Nonomuraea sp. NEAU-A123 TaxID=2839649 RepID=UPI001BE4310D|nr:hypothetical protein [Nonomuraea sp. NEAU-A123]MBT2226231.1 hypothetical protein [Nonomuraea sp. NEAU-A123]
MTTEIALVARTDVPASFDDRMKLAEVLSDAGILPDHLRGKTGNIVAMMMTAATLDIPFMTAAQEMYCERGKIGMSANLMRGLVLRAGHDFEILEDSTKACTVRFTRKGKAPSRPVTYTMEDAQLAGLTTRENSNYRKNPRAMMVARATSRCLRAYASDILLGFGYTPDELRDRIDETVEAELVDVDQPVGPAQPNGEPSAVQPSAHEPVDADIVEYPATMAELVDEVATVVPGATAKTRKAAEDRLRDLWTHARDQKWVNTPASDDDARPIGNVILARQEWLKTAPAGSTGPADFPGQQTLDQVDQPKTNSRARRTTAANGATR